MKIIDFEEEEKKRYMEYPKFRLIQGGKEPPNSFNEYWLQDLEEHAVFIARQKKGEIRWIGHEYHLKIKIGNAFMLRLVQWDPEKQKERIHLGWFDGPEFCKEWDCIEVLDDGKSYRANIEEGLDGHERIEEDNHMGKNPGQETVSAEFGNEHINIK